MTASALLLHFLSLADWVDPTNTVDQVIIGDTETPLSRVLVTWISSFDAVRAAVARRCELLVTHEPTFWSHGRELERAAAWPPDSPRAESARRKRAFIEEHGLVILRIHDVWDRMPEIGIPWAWARFLGFAGQPAVIGADGYQHRYDIAPLTLDALACRVAEKTSTIGEPAVQVVGETGQVASKVGVGTGCGCDPLIFQQMGCDVSVVCDDGSCYWESIQRVADDGHAIIRVNHGTSEEPGMVTLAQHIRDSFPTLHVEHLPHEIGRAHV